MGGKAESTTWLSPGLHAAFMTLKTQLIKALAPTLLLGPVHRGGCTVVDSSSRRWAQAASWSLQPRRVTGHGGTHCPAAGTAAVHPHVSTGEGRSLTPD